MMETKPKVPCSYGSKCYRKNPKHFELYSHPNEPKANLAKKEEKVTKKSEKATHVAKDRKKEYKPERNEMGLGDSQTKKRQTTIEFENEMKIKKPRMSDVCSQVKGTNRQTTKTSKRNKRFINKTTENCNTSQGTVMKTTSNTGIVSWSSKENTSENIDENEFSKSDNDSSDTEITKSTAWVVIKKTNNETKTNSPKINLEEKSVDEIIKYLFLFDMPKCFYSFFDFCKFINSNEPMKALQLCGLKLVGPFDVLLGKMNLSIEKDLALCHWRYYYDPPEFQTVLATDSGFHIGYWRDDPNELPVFCASNNSEKDCVFKIEADNLFGAVHHYLENLINKSDPFTRMKITKFQTALSDWAKKEEFSLEKNTGRMSARQKKVVTKSFHRAGIVVPVEKKTELGYRPLLETEANIKKMCKNIIEAEGQSEKEALWENLHPLINAANIANDECDFGNSLELGIDLFCMGSEIFHETVKHLLSTAYSLLNRTEFGEIIEAHLKRRKNGHDLSVN